MTSPADRSVAAFVRARRPAWERLDGLARRAARGRLRLAEVEELDRLYRRAAADLALARSRFGGSDAEGHLSELVAATYRALYRPRHRGAALLRLVREIPETARRHLPALALAALLFSAGLLCGAAAVALEPSAAEVLVPAPVREAVVARRMWTGHLVSAAPGVAGAALLHNNVTAAVLAFGFGLTAGLGTALILALNGLLLGAVLAHVAQHGMAGDLLGFVAAHGPLELSALVVAGAAGLILAAGIVDPGERPRREALQAQGREAASLLVVVVPALMLAALLEAGVSPRAAVPTPAKAALGLALGATLWGWLLRRGRAAAAPAPARPR